MACAAFLLAACSQEGSKAPAGMGGVGNALGGAGLGDMMGKLDGPGGAGGLPGLGGPGAPQLPPGFENFLKKK